MSDQSSERPPSSGSSSSTSQSRVQRPSRAVQHTAPGVLTSQELPRARSTLATGDVVGGRFRVERYLGSSGGGVSYLCTDTVANEEVVIKVLDGDIPDKEGFDGMYRLVRMASQIQHRNLTRIIGMGRVPGDEVFVAMEFVKGQTLSSVISSFRAQGRSLNIRDTFKVIAHVCSALEAVHEQMPHGVLTPYNIHLEKHGVVRVGNLAFGKIAGEMLVKKGLGPFVDSVYVAPEVSETPELMTVSSDIYSLGMITAELLSPEGLSDDRSVARQQAATIAAQYPPTFSKLISRAISEDFAGRPRTAAQFREEFERVLKEMGTNLQAGASSDGLTVESVKLNTEDDLFDIPELAGLGAEPSDTRHERYLVQKDGLDYGPFTSEQVLEQLYGDEIDENSMVLDRLLQERIPLGQMAGFQEEVAAYIPVREERRRREAEARAELQRKVKKGGYGLLAAAIVGGLVVIGLQLWFYMMQPDPEPLPLENAFASLDFKFLPPPREFQEVAVDKEFLENIFNPRASEEEIQKAIAQRRRRTKARPKARTKQAVARAADDENITEIDMSASGTDHILSDAEVNDVIIANFGGLRSCIMEELRRDPNFRGVTIQFFIRPSGTTGGVRIQESQHQSRPVADCLATRFRSMRFPEHGGFNRGVTYPLYVQ